MDNLTLGESRVRTANPTDNDTVNRIKQKSAELIDLYNELPMPEKCLLAPGEFLRLKALATTAVEEAAMWGVKAATI